jgi:hypothetical protein
MAGDQSGFVTFGHGQYASGENTNGYTFFYLSGTKTGNPACSTYDRWVIDNDWPVAKIQIATLLAAVVSGRPVAVSGTGNCAVWGDSETANDVRLQ